LKSSYAFRKKEGLSQHGTFANAQDSALSWLFGWFGFKELNKLESDNVDCVLFTVTKELTSKLLFT
jgi:hypothetical protein